MEPNQRVSEVCVWWHKSKNEPVIQTMQATNLNNLARSSSLPICRTSLLLTDDRFVEVVLLLVLLDCGGVTGFTDGAVVVVMIS